MLGEWQATFDHWIDRARQGEVSDSDFAKLAIWLADSGEKLAGTPLDADLASTGGPGSLATLWTPPALVANGYRVPKLGVPGRPAGGVDVLSQIPGYTICFGSSEANAILDSCGYVHMISNEKFAPADASLFAYRQKTGAQAIPALAIASLLSKKIAMGVKRVGLEVRVANHGNFGATQDEARVNAFRFIRVAHLLGLRAVCFLTDGMIPQQPYVGRGEALVALSLATKSEAPQWLEEHLANCEEWAATITGTLYSPRSEIIGSFSANLIAQGSSVDAFESRVDEIACAHSENPKWLLAPGSGEVRYDLRGLRDAILDARGTDQDFEFNDSVGLILAVKTGHTVEKGDPLMSVRCPDAIWPAFETILEKAVTITDPVRAATKEVGLGALEIIGV
ncbi:hypothetical protein [Rhizobium leguminosarum]|uniref:hypothetical protein n=1 Tax=Rhizobium leguminosarum TaxID=384 RepID=UPI001C973E07|nr:hypothetical protein [Rhizobium leguminosarum]MBY5738162.1 hypothetical protein [Rhizobium leguminosarum]